MTFKRSTPRTCYLSSLESTRFEPVRTCQLVESLAFDTGKDAVRAVIDPPIVGQDFGRGEDIDTVILAARHEGVTVDPITEFPCFVFIAIPEAGRGTLATPIRMDDLQVIGWGELYPSYDDAAQHRFG